MYQDVEEAFRFVERVFGAQSAYLALCLPDGNLTRTLKTGTHFEGDAKSAFGLVPKEVEGRLRYQLKRCQDMGTASLTWLTQSATWNATLLNLTIQPGYTLVALAIQPDAETETETQFEGLDYLQEADVIGFRWQVRTGQLCFSHTPTGSKHLTNTLFASANLLDDYQAPGMDLREALQQVVASGRRFTQQDAYIPQLDASVTIKAWPVQANGQVVEVNGFIRLGEAQEGMRKTLEASQVMMGFTTNLFGRQSKMQYQSAEGPHSGRVAKALLNHLSKNNLDFQSHCRSALNTGKAQSIISLEIAESQSIERIELNSRLEYAADLSPERILHVARQAEALPNFVPALVAANPQSADQGELLVRESSHRIKNHLSLLSSMLQLQLIETDDKEAHHALQATIERIRAVADLHEQLYNTAGTAGMVDMKQYLKLLKERIKQSLDTRKIKFKVKAESIELDAKRASLVGMIATEIILNSIKYAFSQTSSGIIAVSFYSTENTLYLSVEDNGSGVSPDILDKEKESLGTTLIQEFTKQLGGTLRLDDSVGTRYLISFAATKKA